MPTKSELENQINDRLRTDIEWSQMKKDDLVKFREGLEDEDFIKMFVAQYANDVAGNKTQDTIEGWQPGEGLKMLAQLQEGEANPLDMLM
ncbi:MAG: hypothetical protein J07AB43_01480 [Candidatus Nanosalina sp. J07AB43]|jgi:hypothetical protein|nr:MAG: hypothetical protein J07AB43_01480 [Candidatus Nanosalina sp. J07AB43]